MTVDRWFKVLNEDGTPCHGGTGRWELPTDAGPGEWMPTIADVEPCVRGYHICKNEQVLDWLGPAIFEVDWRAVALKHGDKYVASDARLVRRYERWDDRTARLFAADCAERVLPIYEAACPGDGRPRAAVEVARAFVEGHATAADLHAAEDAAWAASRDAAGAAAWAAARASARDAAQDAARDAARAAARAAAWAAAWDAAWDAERAWQYRRLCDYLDGRAT